MEDPAYTKGWDWEFSHCDDTENWGTPAEEQCGHKGLGMMMYQPDAMGIPTPVLFLCPMHACIIPQEMVFHPNLLLAIVMAALYEQMTDDFCAYPVEYTVLKAVFEKRYEEHLAKCEAKMKDATERLEEAKRWWHHNAYSLSKLDAEMRAILFGGKEG